MQFCKKKTRVKYKPNDGPLKANPMSFANKTLDLKEIKTFDSLHKLDVDEIFFIKDFSSLGIPLFESRIQAGFPSPGDELREGSLDLNDYLIPHKDSTFLVRVTGDSMINVGIFPGDLLIVDNSLVPTYGKIAVVVLNGEMTVKRLEKDKNGILLGAENDTYPDIKVTEYDHFSICGVVTNVIHSLA